MEAQVEFKEMLREILGWIAYGRVQPDSEGNPEQVQVSTEETEAAILALFREVLEMVRPERKLSNKHRQGGWNSCLNQLEANIKKTLEG